MSRQRASAKPSRRRGLAGLCGAVLMLVMSGGCYTYQPTLAPSPEPGGRYRFTLSDAGRVAVAERMGSGVLEIEGDLASATAEEYAIRVWGVRTIADGLSRWSGESVTVRREHVANTSQRQFSRGRTVLAVGGVLAAVVTFALSRQLLGAGSDPEDDDPPEPPVN